jgi:hypothetical protein
MNKKLKAAHSHFIAERDRLIAELDTLLNSQTNPDSLDKVFYTFREMAVVNMAIGNIESIIADNELPVTEPSGITLNQLEQINRMAEALREKMNEGGSVSENDNKNQNDA